MRRHTDVYDESAIRRRKQAARKTLFDYSSVGVVLFITLALMCSVPPSFAQTGKLRVKAVPPQAFVFVDGKAIHEASKDRIALSPGDHKVDVYNYGYKPVSRNVTIQAGKTETVDVKLDPVPGDVTPPWGCITIEGANHEAVLLNGKTPDFLVGQGDEFDHNWWWKQELIVPPGTHQLTVLSGDKEIWSGPVTVQANKRVVVDVPKGVRKTVDWPRGEKLKSLARFKAGTASATVAVAKPTGQVSAGKTQINCGESTQVKWSTTDAPSVEISGIGKVAGSGEQNVQPDKNTTYTLTSTGPGGTVTNSAAVSVNSAIQASVAVSPGEVKFRKVGDKVVEQSKANLTWSTSNASSVSITGLGQVQPSGSRSFDVTPQKTSLGPVDETVTYTLNATNACGGSASRTANLHITGAIEEEPKPPAPEVKVTLNSVYFPTNQPMVRKPEGGLVQSQEGTLTTLASEFKQYLTAHPDAKLVLVGHTDIRGSVKYNQALSERRANRVKKFLTDNGIPEANIEAQGVGKKEQLTSKEVRQMIEQQANLNEAERKKLLRRLSTIALAENRRVDISLSTTNEQSARQYPFEAPDSATLIRR